MKLLSLAILFFAIINQAYTMDYQGSFSYGDTTFFEQDNDDDNKDRQNTLEFEMKVSGSKDKILYQLEGMARTDLLDDGRNITTPLDTYIKYQSDKLSLSAGYHIFNYSVLEVFHPVDTLNSRNLDITGEKIERLGQPSVIFTSYFTNSSLSLILFTEVIDPKMPSEKNRSGPQFDLGNPIYVTGDYEQTTPPVDYQYGARYKVLLEPVELDLQIFKKYATHQPFALVPEQTIINADDIVVKPYFFGMTQYSGAMTVPVFEGMFKSEVAYYDLNNFEIETLVYQDNYPFFVGEAFKPQDFGQIANGWEYTKYYSNDQEGSFYFEHQFVVGLNDQDAKQYSMFQNDFAFAYRHSFNDFNSFEFNTSYIIDLQESSESIFNLGINFRFWESFKFDSALRIINAKKVSTDIADANDRYGLRPLRMSDNIQFKVTKYF